MLCLCSEVEDKCAYMTVLRDKIVLGTQTFCCSCTRGVR